MNEINKLDDKEGKLIFSKDNFVKDYFDKENDLPNEIMIINKLIYGALIFNNKLVTKFPFIFKLSEVNNLEYIRTSSLEFTEEINFKINDTNQNTKFSDMATMTINVNAKINQPPVIGNNTISIEYDEVIVFGQDDFTTNTTPPYSDAEGNPPYKLKVLSLPLTGNLTYNDISVTINQEILFTDINSGLLKFSGNKADINGESISFNFTISDTGSQIYA